MNNPKPIAARANNIACIYLYTPVLESRIPPITAKNNVPIAYDRKLVPDMVGVALRMA